VHVSDLSLSKLYIFCPQIKLSLSLVGKQ
jgi:hypothetical protein